MVQHRMLRILTATAGLVLFITLTAIVQQWPRQWDVAAPAPGLGSTVSSPGARAPIDRISDGDLNTTLPLPLLQPRTPNPYNEARIRGRKLLGYLQNPDSAPKSQWTKYQDLADWGWTLQMEDTSERTDAFTTPLRPALESKQLTSHAPPNVDIQWEHSKKTTHSLEGKGVEYYVCQSVAMLVV